MMMNKGTKVSRSVVASLLAVTLLSGAFSLSGCASADSADATTAPAPKTQITNAEMEQRVKDRLGTNAQLKAAHLDVYANVDHNVVTVSGVVESKLLRTQAVELARNIQAGLTVIAKIDVRPIDLSRTAYTKERATEERSHAKARGEIVGDSLDDGWIHETIVTQLIGRSTAADRKINVNVTNNRVTLLGMVETAEQKAEAERVAQNTSGVKSVNNQLKVGSAVLEAVRVR